MRTRKFKIILLAALAVRLLPLMFGWNAPEHFQTPDSQDYLALSETLADDVRFARDERPEIFRTPGYPFLLTIAQFFGPGGWRAVLLLQIAIDVFTVYLVFLLAGTVADERAGLWAMGFQALTAAAVVASVRILSDSLLAMFLTLAILLLVYHFRSGTLWPVIAAAVAAAAGCYIRPAGLAFVGIATCVLLARPLRWRRSGAFAGIVVALLLPWMVRNAVVADYYGFSSFAGDSLYYFGASQVTAETEDVPPQHIRQVLREEEQWRLYADQDASAGAAAGRRLRRAAGIIAEHPLRYLRIHLVGSLAVWLPQAAGVLEVFGIAAGQRGTLDVLHREGLVPAAEHYLDGRTWWLILLTPPLLILGAKYISAAVGIILRARGGWGAGGWLIVLTVIVYALAAGPAATPRFRVPITPMISIAAGLGATWLQGRLSRPRNRSERPAN